jgi:hypothetical protein
MWEPRRLTTLGSSRPVTGTALPSLYLHISLNNINLAVTTCYTEEIIWKISRKSASAKVSVSYIVKSLQTRHKFGLYTYQNINSMTAHSFQVV